MSSTKDKKPTLAGQRIRSRKRDEKVKYDPEGFRDEIVKGLSDCQDDFEKAYKFLDATGGTQDYRRYAESLFDILISGGLMAPGGEILPPLCPFALFEFPDRRETAQAFGQMLQKVLRRYKYLEVSLEEEFCKVVKFIKTFSEANRAKLARLLAVLMSLNIVSAKPITSLSIDAVVREGLALDFVTTMFRALLLETETSMATIGTQLRKEKIDLLELMPPSQRTIEHFRAHCAKIGGLDDVVAWQGSLHARDQAKQFQKDLVELLATETPVPQIVDAVKDMLGRFGLTEGDVVDRVFTVIMEAGELEKKADVSDAAVRQVRTYAPVLGAVTTQVPSQLALMNRMQTYCYDNTACTKLFKPCVVLLYKTDVVTEDAILAWHAGGASPKGRTVFFEQMQEMIDWLKSAEEESDDDED